MALSNISDNLLQKHCIEINNNCSLKINPSKKLLSNPSCITKSFILLSSRQEDHSYEKPNITSTPINHNSFVLTPQQDDQINYPYSSNQIITTRHLEQTNGSNVSTSSTTLQMSSDNDENYLQYDNQDMEIVEKKDWNKKPWWIWGIGGIDILSMIWYTVLYIHKILTKSDLDFELDILQIPGIVTRLVMGMSMTVGIINEKESLTIFYFKIWIVCQLIFSVSSVIEIITGILVYATPTSSQNLEVFPPPILACLMVFVYRVVTVIMVRLFLENLKSQCVELRNVTENEDETEREV